MQGMMLIGLIVGSIVFLGPVQAILAWIYGSLIYSHFFMKGEQDD